MPTSPKAREVILNVLRQNPTKIYELGSGWGHLAFPLARRFPKAKIEAYEISPIPYWVAKTANKFLRYKNLNITRGDFMKISLKDADCVVCYLFRGGMAKLQKKFEEELPQGAQIVTNSFSIPNWTAEQVVEIKDLWRTKILVYQKH